MGTGTGTSTSTGIEHEIAWEGYCGEHPTPDYRLEDAISIDLKRS
jgi:hypothetical protein